MKFSEYSLATSLNDDDAMLIDGSSGTKRIKMADAALASLSMTSVYNRRNVVRGKNLGSVYTPEQEMEVKAGSFKNLGLGDYWEKDGVKWRIVDFDYWRHTGDTDFASHHLVIMPDSNLTNAKMNSSNVTTGGYLGSELKTTTLASVKTTVENMFSGKILTHREYLINAVTGGYPSAGAWSDSDIDLPNEPMIFGSYIITPGSDGTALVKRYTNSARQLALFRIAPEFILGTPDGTRLSYWLRDIASATAFVRVTSYGPSTEANASQEYGIRPVFAIG